MAIRALNVRMRNYICEFDDPENPTVFYIQPMTARQYSNFEDYLGDKGTITPEAIRQALLYGLKGWDNLIDENEEQVDDDLTQGQRVDLLPVKVRLEIGTEIISISNLNDRDKMDLFSPPSVSDQQSDSEA